ncbi:kynurenine 3-monooxygenase [Pseudanabaena sp. lw0831]|uniref:FAD-dependent oxidoreductase n=1 Tax=Pseudanabaena sp. lw0831 TaxID=1357935 RepID=UPI0019164E46|nr:NAD(P)/FAD-dependent oxidoreductase [Pseudanabaena sp. lw0831]GBO56626.1 kynurenine 3-monooxygenase [Pseudanabaena sp. lw0831]
MTSKIFSDVNIAIVGGGPAALVAAIALARRGIRTQVFERDAHPELSLRFNPERSYAIDISGHGLKALRYIDACNYFDARMFQFKGLKFRYGETEESGWTGSRGDILRSLMATIEAKYSEWIDLHFECRVHSVDVHTGILTYEFQIGGMNVQQFDFIIGADGAGSIIRKAMVEQIPEFTVQSKSLQNYSTMIELDLVGDKLDKHYLYGLAITPFCIAGAIAGEHGLDIPRWFCAIGTKTKQVFSTTEEAYLFLRKRVPKILELASEEKISAYAKRTCYHIGQTLTCSQLYGGKAVLLGDAAAAFPPIGQGVNAAMESSMVLDLCIGEIGTLPSQLLKAAKLYNNKWKLEADAVSWMSEKLLYENPFHLLRAMIATKLGLCIFNQAKSVDIPYSEVKRKAKRFGILWA